MAEKEVFNRWKEDQLIVTTKKDGKFKEALLNCEKMVEKNVGADDPIDLNSIEQDFIDFPKIKGGNVEKGNTYAYSIPIRNRLGVIIKWVCGGSGPYACGG